MWDTYVLKGKKRLRRGYTTGTCAAAASMAAAIVLLGPDRPDQVVVHTPGGVDLNLSVRLDPWTGQEPAGAWVQKDGGDDPDVTNGLWIQSRISRKNCWENQPGGWYTHKTENLTLYLRGGVGIGTVTLPGLSCEVGKSAINPVPRQMIFAHVEQICRQYGYRGELWICICAPEGEERAKKTLNGRLGVLGGISILGTTGIVEPMSEKALTETIRLEMRRHILEGQRLLLLTPGNYGRDFLSEQMGLDLDRSIKCSNFIGQSIDMAQEEGAQAILLVGHGGKLIKTAAGIMDTHSSMADGRAEILGAHAGACGASARTIQAIFRAVTVDQALDILDQEEGKEMRDRILEGIVRRMEYYLKHRAGEGLAIEAVVFTCQKGLLGMTSGAQRMIDQLRAEKTQQEV